MPETIKLKLNGMTCQHCVTAVKKGLEALPGVKFASVSLEKNTAEVEFDSSISNSKDLLGAVEKAGYEAEF